MCVCVQKLDDALIYLPNRKLLWTTLYNSSLYLSRSLSLSLPRVRAFNNFYENLPFYTLLQLYPSFMSISSVTE